MNKRLIEAYNQLQDELIEISLDPNYPDDFKDLILDDVTIILNAIKELNQHVNNFNYERFKGLKNDNKGHT